MQIFSHSAELTVNMTSGLIYRSMGFPLDFFPVLFAVPRVVGWLAHWRQVRVSLPRITTAPRLAMIDRGNSDR